MTDPITTPPTTPAPAPGEETKWYVLRDLKRSNAKTPAYKMLADQGFHVYVPMKWAEVVQRGKRRRVQVPAISGMLFTQSTREALDPVINSTPTLQHIYVRGGYREPMVVRNTDMDNFIRAVEGAPSTEYLDEATAATLNIGDKVRIVGGALDGVYGNIVKIKGARKKRIVVSIPGFVWAMVEVSSGECVVFK